MKPALGSVLFLVFLSTSGALAEPLTLRPVERIVFVGATTVERQIQHNDLEARLLAAFPDHDLTFRNLGWSGDNVQGHSRTVFEPLEKGVDILIRHIREQEPTLVLLAYGMNESFRGPRAIEPFIGNYRRLLDRIQEMETRVALISPVPHENLGAPLPDPREHNASLRQYVQAIEALARERSLPFIDVFTPFLERASQGPGELPALTDNGIHLTPLGYWLRARAIATALGAPPDAWSLSLSVKESVSLETEGVSITHLEIDRQGVKFRARDEHLPVLPAGDDVSDPALAGRTIRVRGLEPGTYTLRVDGQPVAEGDAKSWERGIVDPSARSHPVAGKLRSTLARKNELFFHRWRPANETYLFLFRKHEQGNNAREIPRFDPLIAAEERKLDSLVRPPARTYELIRSKGRLDS